MAKWWQVPAALVALTALTCIATAADDEPPIVGQPDHFNGAVGRFQIAATADRTKLQAEDPLVYSVRITAEGRVKQPPQRPSLAEFTGFAQSFYIEDFGPPAGKKVDDHTWEFGYRLKPKNTDVKAVPGFPFVFFRPGFLPPRLGYMTLYVRSIPITVVPREAVTSAMPLTAPDEAFLLADGDVLRNEAGARLPGPGVLLLMALVPPAGCLVWCLVWRRLYPDVARTARRRRSRAAQEALRALSELARVDDSRKRARRAAEVIAGYLRQRLDLAVQEPTPAEAEAHLRRQGVSAKLAGQTAELLRTCAAVQFDPDPGPAPDFRKATSRLILSLEAETWQE
jgi:hypothetical protein